MKGRIITTKLLGLGIVGLALISHTIYSEDSIVNLVFEVLAYILLGISAFGRTWASAFISGKKNKSLITDGPYSVVRNPLYFFSFVGYIGAGLSFGSISIAAALAFVFFFTHWPTILKEEKKLAVLFAESYENYKNTVSRFIPHPRLMNIPKRVSLSTKIFSKALLESSIIMSIFLVAQIIKWAQFNSFLPIVFKLY